MHSVPGVEHPASNRMVSRDERGESSDFRRKTAGQRRAHTWISEVISRKLFTNTRNADLRDAAKSLQRWLAALDDFRNWLIREAA